MLPARPERSATSAPALPDDQADLGTAAAGASPGLPDLPALPATRDTLEFQEMVWTAGQGTPATEATPDARGPLERRDPEERLDYRVLGALEPPELQEHQAGTADLAEMETEVMLDPLARPESREREESLGPLEPRGRMVDLAETDIQEGTGTPAEQVTPPTGPPAPPGRGASLESLGWTELQELMVRRDQQGTPADREREETEGLLEPALLEHPARTERQVQ